MLTLGNGRPIVIFWARASILARVAQIAASVGPYWFHTTRHFFASWIPRLSGNTSPPTTACILAPPCQPCSSRRRYTVGVPNITVAPERRTCSARGAPADSLSTRNKLAPKARGKKISRHATSNAMVDPASTVSSVFNCRSCPPPHTVLARAPWVILTPFGLPVDPEV